MPRTTKTKAEKLVRLMLRLPESLHKKITESADLNRRSLNSELIVRLERSLKSENS